MQKWGTLVLSLGSALMLILGGMSYTLSPLLLLLFQGYILWTLTAPLIRDPHQEYPPFFEIALPLLWVTGLWGLSAFLIKWVAYTSTLSAFFFGLVLSITPHFFQPLVFLCATCLEVSLVIGYPMSEVDISFHIISHLITSLSLPRLISVEWIKKSFYPRLLTPEELPLSHRYFVPNLHPLIENPSTPNIVPNAVDIETFTPPTDTIRSTSGEAHHQSYLNLQARQRPSDVHDFGLMTHQVDAYLPYTDLMDLNAASVRHARRAMQFLTQSLTAQLKLLQHQLNLNTAVVVWKKPQSDDAGLKAVVSDRIEWMCDLFPANYGVLDEAFSNLVAFNDPIEAVHLVPYYDRRVTLGGFLAAPIRIYQEGVADGVLCLDRNLNAPWEPEDRKLVESIAQKIAIDVETSRLLKQLSYEGKLVEKLCLGLKSLNRALDLKSVVSASVECVRMHDFVHFVALCIREGDSIRVHHAWSAMSELEVDGAFFPRGADPISQCIWSGEMIVSSVDGYSPVELLPVIVDDLEQMNAAIAFPLRNEFGSGDPIGGLIIASTHPQKLNSPYIEPIKVIIEQISVKLTLTQAHEHLRELATRDGLTGLKNHMTFQSTLEEMLNRAKRLSQPLSLILLDIDHFKKLNDSYGHPFGDLVLKEVAQTLTKDMREVDLVARYGGEEFAIAIETSTLDGALLSAERVRQNVESLSFDFEGTEVKVTISMGVASFPVDGEYKHLLIERADKALYQAKTKGRNRVEAWRNFVSDERHTSVGWTHHSVIALSLSHPPPPIGDQSLAPFFDSIDEEL